MSFPAILTILMLVVGFIAYRLILIVPMREQCVIERLGKFKSILEPGLHFLIPFVDRVFKHTASKLHLPRQYSDRCRCVALY
jgi:regulator of protease activity HflC (stomatin/prohibitin superfamily)